MLMSVIEVIKAVIEGLCMIEGLYL